MLTQFSAFAAWRFDCVISDLDLSCGSCVLYRLDFVLPYLPADLLSAVPSQSDAVRQLIQKLVTQAEELLPKIEDVQAEKMGDLVDQEMALTTKAIEDAASKIAVSLASDLERKHSVISGHNFFISLSSSFSLCQG